ncbi:MAG: murein biosynthesis integral rane protein MurJ [Actinomycetota bacterium]|jgi:putative peptidoglycan lipid II flippase
MAEKSVARSSVIMASGTIVSRILGFARAVLIAAAIGVTTDAADAFGVANQLPNNVYAIIVGGVLNAVLVPQLVRARSQADGGKGYVDRFVTLAITVFFAVTVIFTMAAPLLVQLYTSGWSEDQLALATAFAYWCLPQLFFYGLYSILGEVLNSRSEFGPFMWAPVLNNVVSIAGLVAFILIFGADPAGERAVSLWEADRISLLAGSATLGVAAQALILFVSWKKIGLALNLNFHFRGFGLRPALKAASWSLAMVLVTQIGGLVQTAVASTAVAGREAGLEVASVAAAAIAWLIFMLPHSVVTVSIATAYFTRMSQHAANGKLDEFVKDLTTGLRVIALVSVISTATLMMLAYSIARVFVGEYPATLALGNVIVALMVGLVPFSVVYMIQRAFFALEDTRSPFIFTTIQIAIHITGSLTLGATVPKQWLVVSISILTACSILVQGLVGYLMLRKRIGAMGEGSFIKSLLGFVLAAIPAAAVGYAVMLWLGGIAPGSFTLNSVFSAVLTSALVGAAMVICYLATLWIFRVPELRELQRQLKNRFRRG